MCEARPDSLSGILKLTITRRHALKQTTITTPTTNSVVLEGVYALLYQKVQGLKSGEAFVYHSGSLAADRVNNEQLDALATLLVSMAEKKQVRLCQRRAGEMYYDYLAIGL
jgi:hypothetical protein